MIYQRIAVSGSREDIQEGMWDFYRKDGTMVEELTEPTKQTVKSAARKLTGFRRRQFQAEMAIKYCQGHPRQAEEIFGWGRDAVNTGLNELRTGIRCLDGFSARLMQILGAALAIT